MKTKYMLTISVEGQERPHPVAVFDLIEDALAFAVDSLDMDPDDAVDCYIQKIPYLKATKKDRMRR